VVASGDRVARGCGARGSWLWAFAGGERTTRRAVTQGEEAFRAGRRRVFRPWIPEPGLWIGSRAGFKCTGSTDGVIVGRGAAVATELVAGVVTAGVRVRLRGCGESGVLG
jgi:hypothetical protein